MASYTRFDNNSPYKGRYSRLFRVQGCLSRAFPLRISFRLIVFHYNLPRKGKWHANAPLRVRTLSKNRTVRRYEDENHTDGETP